MAKPVSFAWMSIRSLLGEAAWARVVRMIAAG
jgi:hypothetical protein